MSLALLCVLTAPPLHAAQVYRWTDPDGQVHFSDSAPPAGVVGEAVSDLPDADPPGDDSGAEDYSVEAQAQRMEAERLAREAERQEARSDDQDERIRQLEERVRQAEEETRRLKESEQQRVPVLVRPARRYPGYPYPGSGWDHGHPPPGHMPNRPPPGARPPNPAVLPEEPGGRVGNWRRAPAPEGR